MAAPCLGKKGSLVYFPLTGENHLLLSLCPLSLSQCAQFQHGSAGPRWWLACLTSPPPHTKAVRLKAAWREGEDRGFQGSTQSGHQTPNRRFQPPERTMEDCGVRSWPRKPNVGPADRPAELGGHPLLSALEGCVGTVPMLAAAGQALLVSGQWLTRVRWGPAWADIGTWAGTWPRHIPWAGSGSGQRYLPEL